MVFFWPLGSCHFWPLVEAAGWWRVLLLLRGRLTCLGFCKSFWKDVQQKYSQLLRLGPHKCVKEDLFPQQICWFFMILQNIQFLCGIRVAIGGSAQDVSHVGSHSGIGFRQSTSFRRNLRAGVFLMGSDFGKHVGLFVELGGVVAPPRLFLICMKFPERQQQLTLLSGLNTASTVHFPTGRFKWWPYFSGHGG